MKLGRIKLGTIELGKHCALALALSMALAISSAGGQIVDRVVANVNGHVVLQSDWEQEIAFEAFSNARDPDSFTSPERNAALDRLIDRELLREQLRPSQPAPAEQVAARVAELREQVPSEVCEAHPDCATNEAWHARLQRYGLTQSALEKRLGDEIQ